MPAGVRLADDAEVPALARTLALAHHDYPWAVWAFPHADRFELLVKLFTLDAQIAVRIETAWVVDDGDCVAIWSPPSTVSIDGSTREFVAAAHEEQSAIIDGLISGGAARLAAADALTRPHHPSVPYWYLGTVGTRPDRRGRGLATSVLQPVLDRCDAQRTVACLETSSDDNVRLYERLGFASAFATASDDAAVRLIVMVRQPR
jgi:ribosomal protein S18 acetylase RimI-like enzyme